MNGEHLQDLRYGPLQAITDTNDLELALGDVWAVGMVLAAYDHELFRMGVAGEEGAWAVTLNELLGARAHILADIIPARLLSYRSWRVPADERVA